MNQLGFWGPFVLVILFILQVFLAFIPGQALMVACGYLYGFWGGFLISWLSSFILDAFYDHSLGVPTGYAGGPLSATMTFSAQSFSTLGMTPGEYVYPYYDRQGVRLVDVTVRVGRGTVPEPASLALLGLGLAGIGYQRRKRAA